MKFYGLKSVNKGGIMINHLLLVFIRNPSGAEDILAYGVNRAPVRATCIFLIMWLRDSYIGCKPLEA